MTIIDDTDIPATPAAALAPVTFDLYRDIHKSIRAELFAVTEEAGRADPSSTADRTALVAHVDAVVAIHGAIIASLPPDEMMRSLALMLPAINVDDRTELLGGMRANAPAPVFEAVWRLAGSVLPGADHAALGARLGVR
jgi:hypothetical protein